MTLETSRKAKCRKRMLLIMVFMVMVSFMVTPALADEDGFIEPMFIERKTVLAGRDNFVPSTSSYPFNQEMTSVGFDSLYGTRRTFNVYYGEVPESMSDSSPYRYYNGDTIGDQSRPYSSSTVSLDDESMDPHLWAMTQKNEGISQTIAQWGLSIVSGIYGLSNMLVGLMISIKSFDMSGLLQLFDDGTDGWFVKMLTRIFLMDPETNVLSPFLMFGVLMFVLGLIGTAFKLVKGDLTLKPVLQELFMFMLAGMITAFFFTTSNPSSISKVGIDFVSGLAEHLMVDSLGDDGRVYQYSGGESLTLDTNSTQKALVSKIYIDSIIQAQFGYPVSELDLVDEAGNSDFGDVDIDAAANAATGTDQGAGFFSVITDSSGSDHSICNLGYYWWAANSNVGSQNAYEWSSSSGTQVSLDDNHRPLFVIDLLAEIRESGDEEVQTKVDTIMHNFVRPNYGSAALSVALAFVLNLALVFGLGAITVFTLLAQIIIVLGSFAMVVMPMLLLFRASRPVAKRMMWTYLLAYFRFIIGTVLFNVLLVTVVMLSSQGVAGMIMAVVLAVLMGRFGPLLMQEVNMWISQTLGSREFRSANNAFHRLPYGAVGMGVAGLRNRLGRLGHHGSTSSSGGQQGNTPQSGNNPTGQQGGNNSTGGGPQTGHPKPVGGGGGNPVLVIRGVNDEPEETEEGLDEELDENGNPKTPQEQEEVVVENDGFADSAGTGPSQQDGSRDDGHPVLVGEMSEEDDDPLKLALRPKGKGPVEFQGEVVDNEEPEDVQPQAGKVDVKRSDTEPKLDDQDIHGAEDRETPIVKRDGGTQAPVDGDGTIAQAGTGEVGQDGQNGQKRQERPVVQDDQKEQPAGGSPSQQQGGGPGPSVEQPVGERIVPKREGEVPVRQPVVQSGERQIPKRQNQVPPTGTPTLVQPGVQYAQTAQAQSQGQPTAQPTQEQVIKNQQPQVSDDTARDGDDHDRQDIKGSDVRERDSRKDGVERPAGSAGTEQPVVKKPIFKRTGHQYVKQVPDQSGGAATQHPGEQPVGKPAETPLAGGQQQAQRQVKQDQYRVVSTERVVQSDHTDNDRLGKPEARPEPHSQTSQPTGAPVSQQGRAQTAPPKDRREAVGRDRTAKDTRQGTSEKPVVRAQSHTETTPISQQIQQTTIQPPRGRPETVVERREPVKDMRREVQEERPVVRRQQTGDTTRRDTGKTTRQQQPKQDEVPVERIATTEPPKREGDGRKKDDRTGGRNRISLKGRKGRGKDEGVGQDLEPTTPPQTGVDARPKPEGKPEPGEQRRRGLLDQDDTDL